MKKIYMIGDSLMAPYTIEAYPQFGYGDILKLYLQEGYEIVNLAHAGCSSKSFLDQDRFKVVEEKITDDDLLIVEFGNNDEKDDPLRHTDKDTTFLDNMMYFYNVANKKGAKTIFASSPARRTYVNGVIEDSHKGYPQSLKKFCLENEFYFVDLNDLTTALYNKLGEEKTKQFHLIFEANKYSKWNDGRVDNSHFTLCGCTMVCQLFLDDLLNKYKEFEEVFKNPDVNRITF